MGNKIIHLMHVPFSGLGLYNGFRGNRWLKNRIKIFKQFVIPSLQSQTSKNFVLWCAFRYEEKSNPIVKELQEYMKGIKEFKTVFTFNGICFWDDKYSDIEARSRLISSLHGSIGELLDTIGEVDGVLMTIQPSDDIYVRDFIERIQKMFENRPDIQGIGFTKGYIMNYQTKEIKRYNPKTNPPFYTVKFSRDIFTDPLKHADYTSLKKDVGIYKKGTPCPSHEYIGDCVNYTTIDERGFLVGCHGENVSTHFNHPYGEGSLDEEVLYNFGIYGVKPLKIHYSLRKRILRLFPYKIQRKIRYMFGESIWKGIYDFLRS